LNHEEFLKRGLGVDDKVVIWDLDGTQYVAVTIVDVSEVGLSLKYPGWVEPTFLLFSEMSTIEQAAEVNDSPPSSVGSAVL